MARFRVLGPVEADDAHGTAVPLRSARQRLLLAVLVAEAGRVVAPDRLTEVLWGDALPADPAGALQTQVSRLRRVLGDGAGAGPLETRPAGYVLAAGPDDVDATVFAARLDAARALRSSDPAAALAGYDEALAAWRGRAYAEVADVGELDAEASRLEELRVNAAEERAELLLASGRHGDAVADLERLALEHPLRERLHGLWMRALAGSGRAADALAVYAEVRRRLGEELGLEPGAPLRELETAIVRDELDEPSAVRVAPVADPAAVGVAALPVDLPVPATPLVGRDADVAGVEECLARARIVTVTGTGGVGKTRVALAAARAARAGHPDGIVRLDVAELTEGADPATALATRLAVQERAGSSVTDRLVEFLAARRALVLLDGCELLLDGVADLVDALVTRTDVAVLATSRAPLDVDGEALWPLDPLPVTVVPPESVAGGGATTAGPAVTLFTDRARAADPTFALDAASQPVVEEICRRLDGLPLALELAAARLRVMDLAELARSLDDRFTVLTGGRRTAAARHRSLASVVEWSYRGLDPSEARVLERVSVFATGFDPDAAVAVAADDDVATGDVAPALWSLVDRSLLVGRTGAGAGRFEMLETIRAYGRDRLRDRGELAGVAARHAGWARAFAQERAAVLQGSDPAAATAELDRALPDLRAAVTHLLEVQELDDAARIVGELGRWALDGMRSEVLGWADAIEAALLARDRAHPMLPMVRWVAAVGAWQRGDLDRARSLASAALVDARDALATARAEETMGDVCLFAGEPRAAADHYGRASTTAAEVGDRYVAALNVGNRAIALAYVGEFDEARALTDALLADGYVADTPWMLAWAHYLAGEVRMDVDPSGAAAHLERAVDLARRNGSRFVLGVALVSALSLAGRTGDARRALAGYPELIEHWRRAGAWTQQWTTLRTLIELLAGLGEDGAAAHVARLLGAMRASATAAPVYGADEERLEGARRRVCAALGEERCAALEAEGAALDDPAAVAQALTAVAEVLRP